MKRLLLCGAALALCLSMPADAKVHKPAKAPASKVATISNDGIVAPKDIPAGEYKTDPAHSSLTFQVDHMGFSHYTARFSKIDATLTLDPVHPDKASLTAVIDPQSLELNTPPMGFHDEMMGKMFFEADKYPQITFKSTRVALTGKYTATVTGDLTMHGVTKPAVLAVTFNGGYGGLAGMDPSARAGFSAKGVLKRSDFGMGGGIPAPGSNLGVGDQIEFAIETEMSGPALKK